MKTYSVAFRFSESKGVHTNGMSYRGTLACSGSLRIEETSKVRARKAAIVIMRCYSMAVEILEVKIEARV